MSTLLVKPNRVPSGSHVVSAPNRKRLHPASLPAQPSPSSYPAQPSTPMLGARLVAGPSVASPHCEDEPQFSSAGMLLIMISLAVLVAVATVFLGIRLYLFLTSPELVEGAAATRGLLVVPLGW